MSSNYIKITIHYTVLWQVKSSIVIDMPSHNDIEHYDCMCYTWIMTVTKTISYVAMSHSIMQFHHLIVFKCM